MSLTSLSRSIRRSFQDRSFATVFIVTLALGVGANAALLSALRGYLVRPLPYHQAHNLVVVRWRVPQISSNTLSASVPIYQFISQQNDIFPGAGLASSSNATITRHNHSHTVQAAQVTASLFATLGIRPYIGSFFSSEANHPGGPQSIVVSYKFWKDTLRADPNVVGKSLIVNGVPHRISGVLRSKDFFPKRDIAIYLPMRITPAAGQLTQATQSRGILVARSAVNANGHLLDKTLSGLSRQFVQRLPPQFRKVLAKAGFTFVYKPLRSFLYGGTARRLGLIELGALVLLALAVVNLMNLTLVKTLRRRHEVAMRLALGARRRSLLSLALTETLPLGFVSWLAALGIAYGGTALLQAFGVGANATAFSITLDPPIVFTGLGISLLGTFLASVPLVMAPRRALLSRLVEGARGTASRGASRVQRTLSILQVAFAVALLVNAVLLGLTLKRLSTVAPGFNPNHLIAAQMTLQGPHFKDHAKAVQFAENLRKRTELLPGVKQATLSGGGIGFPFLGTAKPSTFAPGGTKRGSRATFSSKVSSAHALIAGDDFLGTLQLRLLRGRAIRRQSHEKTQGIMIDRKLALRFFGTTDVIGKTLIRSATRKEFRIEGVVAHLLWGPPSLTDDLGTVIMPYAKGNGQSIILLARSKSNPSAVINEIRSLLAQLAPDQSFTRIVPMHELMRESLAPLAAPASLYALFGLIAVLLAAVGVYGVVSYRVRLRLSEFAVRQALGATPVRIVLLALREGVSIAVTGILCGLIGGWWLHYFTGNGAGLHALLPYFATTIIMATVILSAALIPAMRARRTNLIAILRPQ